MKLRFPLILRKFVNVKKVILSLTKINTQVLKSAWIFILCKMFSG